MPLIVSPGVVERSLPFQSGVATGVGVASGVGVAIGSGVGVTVGGAALGVGVDGGRVVAGGVGVFPAALGVAAGVLLAPTPLGDEAFAAGIALGAFAPPPPQPAKNTHNPKSAHHLRIFHERSAVRAALLDAEGYTGWGLSA